MFSRMSARKIALLFLLYFVQGLPSGFQGKGLKAFLTLSGVSLTNVSLTTALSYPWMLKALWAPLVDSRGSARFGRRKSWIVPLQLLLALSCGLAGFAPPEQHLVLLLGLVLLMNLFAATQDIAVDGLAIDLLSRDELGMGNMVQVVGFKAGLLVAGGLLLKASETLGFHGYFGVMSALILGVLVVVAFFREPAPNPTANLDTTVREATEPPAQDRSFVGVVRIVLRALKAKGALWILLFIGTYKLGESMLDGMFTPFLIRSGFTVGQIGIWTGTYGLIASIAGSIAGGLLVRRLTLLRAVGTTAFLRSLSMVGAWLLATAPPSPLAVIAVTITENFFGGALTTAMFAFMMARVDRSVGATHYTLLASVEVWGKMPGSLLSGYIADKIGFSRLFALAAALSFAFLLLLVPLREKAEPKTRLA